MLDQLSLAVILISVTFSDRAISSGGEHYLDTVGVTSSNLVSPTIES